MSGCPARLPARLPVPDGTADRAARLIAETIRARVRVAGRAAVALCGGRSPQAIFRRLARAPHRRRIPWDRVHWFWVDERCVPASHPHSNFGLANRLLFSRVPAPAGHLHRVPTELVDPSRIASAYEAQLRAWFRTPRGRPPVFDLILLGVGADGHVASLFPGSAALRECWRLVVPSRGGRPPMNRVTVTLPVLNAARAVLILAAGAVKRGVVRRMAGAQTPADRLPVHLIQPSTGRVTWLVNCTASSGGAAAGGVGVG